MIRLPIVSPFLNLVLANTLRVSLLLIHPLTAQPLCADTLQLNETCTVRFASDLEAADVLGADDPFVQRLSRFDLQSRLQTDQPVTSLDYRKTVVAGIQPWTETAKNQILAPLKILSQKIEPLRLPLPEDILLICTNGQGEANAPHTRSNAIILPQKRITSRPDEMLRLLAHELFHIVSRHDPTLRDALYEQIGFKPCRELKVPDAWNDRRITNPDAPIIEHYLEVKVGDLTVAAAPMLFSRVPLYNAQEAKTFFQYLDLRFVQLERSAESWAIAIDEQGNMISYAASELGGFVEQVGNNTNYIIHPEEILADNFSFLVSDKQVPTPEIVVAMDKVFRNQATRQDQD